MQTNIVSSIFLLVFLKNVSSDPKLAVVDLINRGSDHNRQLKLNEALKLIKDEHLHKLQNIIIRDLDKFDGKGVKFSNNDEFDYYEPELDYNKQETIKVENCRSLLPKDIRECLEYNIKQIQGQRDNNEMRAERDLFENFKTPEDCMALEATVFVQLECLAKFKVSPMDSKGIKHFESEKNDFVNVRSPEDCWKIKNTSMSRKILCLKTFYKKNDETDVYEFMNLKDPTDCLSLKTTIKNKNKCLDQFGKANDDNYKAFLGDDFDNLTEPNDCLFLKETMEVKLKCLDKFQKVEEKANQKTKEMTIPTVDEITLREDSEIINSPEDCLFAHNTYGKKLKCLEQFENHKKNIRSRIIEPNHQFVATRPKRKIYSFYNYYNALMKPAPFRDLTRQEFSQDYLDISELSRSIPKCRSPACNVDLLKLSYQLKEKKANLNNSRRFFDSVHTRFIQDDSDDSDEIVVRKPRKRKVQKKKNGLPIRFTVVSKEERPIDSDSDEHRNLKAGANWESFEDKQDSEEEHRNLKKKKKSPKKKTKSSAEGNYKKTFLFFESEEGVNKGISSESEATKKSFVKNKNKKKKAKKPHVDDDYSIETERPSSFKYSYLQGNNIVDLFRRRLEHFLPKRFHWEEKDFRNLGYYWYDGPRGRWSK